MADAAATPTRSHAHEALCLAYGWLWHSTSADPCAQQARMALLTHLSRDDQRHGIHAARAQGAQVDAQALEAAMLRGGL